MATKTVRQTAKKSARKVAAGSTKQATARTRRATGGTSKSDWRAATLARVRRLIRTADPEAVEEIKWRKPSNPAGVPVWSHHGILCTGETYKEYVKLTFAKGASLEDPTGVFNASLGAGTRRAIDIREGSVLDEAAFKNLIRAAVVKNLEDHDQE